MSLQTIIKKVWYPDEGRHIPALAVLLYPLAMAYGNIIRLRNRLYDRRVFSTHRLPCPVISVGNITVGGGPAPVRAYIEELLPDVLEGRIEPGRVFDRVIGLEATPDGYRAMNERKAIKVMVKP